jgi:ribosomal protein S12 methylthiotransferase accessory factor
MPEPAELTGLVGAGVLRAAIERRLPGELRANAKPVLAVSDGWDVAFLTETAATAAAQGVPFLGVHVELGLAVLGPAVLPGVPGCLTCVATRRAAADLAGAADRAALLDRHGARLAQPSAWLTTFAVDTIAGLAAAELEALHAGRTPRTAGAVLTVDLRTLATGVHPYLPDPLCPACSTMPDDTPEAATVRLESRPKPAPHTLRVVELAGREQAIRESYVDDFTGLVSAVRDVDACGLPVSYAPTGWPEKSRIEMGIGRASDRATSGLAAVLEAVERRAGTKPSGKRVRVRGSFRELARQAVDPRELGLLPPESYGPNGLGYRRFDPDLELDWVWGYSFGRAEPVLVPRTYAYYGHFLEDGSEPPLVYETSNGCALGNCYEEAAVYGLLEIAERDAFLMTWYARLAAPRVAIDSARSADIRLLAERLERVHGYRVLCFDTTLEQDIPAVAVLAVDLTPDEPRPAIMCAAAAHLDPERACWAALGELALVVTHHLREYPERRDTAAAMVADSGLVRAMEDHAFLYGHRDTVPRWDFLLSGKEERSFAEAFSGRPRPADDLRDDLLELIRRYRESGLDVIVVDQTGPEQRARNLVAVKAIVPGTLPITFDHANRRVHGLPRLGTVPMLLGHRTDPLPLGEINPYPHPFP